MGRIPIDFIANMAEEILKNFEQAVFSPDVSPQDKEIIERLTAIPYTTTNPTHTPRNPGTPTFYNNGSTYQLLIYANGAWRDASASFIGGRMYLNGAQSINDITTTKVTFDTAAITGVGITSDTSNSKFTVLTAGKYVVSAQLWYNQPIDGGLYRIMIYLNGGLYSGAANTSGALNLPVSPNITDLISLSVGDTIEIYTFHNSSASKSISAGSDQTYFSIYRV